MTDLVTRFTYYPTLTVDDRYWYFRSCAFDEFDSKPQPGCQKMIRLVNSLKF